MYLNTSKIATYKVINAIVIAACGIPAVCNCVVIIFFMLSTTLERNIATSILTAFFIFATLAEIGVIVWRLITLHRLSKITVYNSLLEEDHDGIIEYSSIASMTGFAESAIIRDLMWFANHKYLVNVTLGRTAIRVDLLSGENEFMKVVCPSCGAHVNIRRNGGGKCEHCGTFMRLKEGQNV